jgi:hypothetical protein
MDTKGEIVIPIKYDSAGGFFEDKAVVRTGSKIGFINKEADFTEFKLPSGKKADLYSTRGEVFDAMFEEGFCALYADNATDRIMYDEEGNLFTFTEKGRYVVYGMSDGLIMTNHPETRVEYMDAEGNVVISRDSIEKDNDLVGRDIRLMMFNDGVTFVNMPQEDGSALIGLIDKTGKIVVEPKYSSNWTYHGLNYGNGFYPQVQVFVTEGVISLADENGKLGGIDKSGNEVLPFEYDSGVFFSEGYGRVRKDGIYGMVDKNGETVIPFEYAAMGICLEGHVIVGNVIDGKALWGMIDIDGNEVIPMEYEFVSDVYNNTVLLSDKSGHVGIYEIK